MTFILRLIFLFLFCFPFTCLAEIPDQLKQDFKPISGTIVMPIGEEYLVDLDASVNLHEGDILTLIMAGEKIIHPDTKETLGTLELAKGYLQVTQVKSGYSYVKLLSAGITPKKGDHIKRFEQTPTRFESTQAYGKLAEELKIALPHLNWLSNSDKSSPELIFHFSDNNLTVVNRAGAELKVYPFRDGQLSAPLSGSHQVDTFQFGATTKKEKSILNQAVNDLSSIIGIGEGKKDKRLENPAITQNQQLDSDIWIGSNLKGNPVGLAVADFDGNGQLETAVAMEDHLQILRMVDGKMIPVATVNFAAALQLLSLDTVDIDADGIPELFLNAHVGTRLSSQVIEFSGGSYQHSIIRVPWFLRVVDLPQEGHILIAQSMGTPETPFFGQPFRVIRSGNKLIRDTELPLPSKLNVFGFVPFKGTNNDLLYAHITTGDYLHVSTAAGSTIWDSGEHFGGSDVLFYNTEDPNEELHQPIFIQQRLVTLPTGEILVPQNEGLRMFERYRDFDKSRIIALKWNGFSLQESWKTSDQGGYLADYSIADADNDGQDELVMAIKYQQKNLIQKGRSAVVIYELNQ